MCDGMQELEQQVQELTEQVKSGSESVRIKELEAEHKLAEERIVELETQLSIAPAALPGMQHV